MLQSLNELGYALEWRVITAADYGMPQRRRRVFLIGHHKSTTLFRALENTNEKDWVLENGILAQAFPVKQDKNNATSNFKLKADLVDITNSFNKNGKSSPFENSGVMVNGEIYTTKTHAEYDGDHLTLGDILQNGEVADDFFIEGKDKDKWEYLKGAKTIERESSNGYKYEYSEGGMIYPDALDNASRTIITGEGGRSPSRFKHVVTTKQGLRRLTPVELERLNMFPDDHTKLDGISDSKRAFFMGNALVVGVVEKIGKTLYQRT